MSDQQTDVAQQIPSSTPDFQTNLARDLQELIPEAITDGKVDIQKLKELLDHDVADDSERFGLFWPGKKRAMRAAQEPTSATLKPSKDESKDWDTTENIFIEGDNLETLKILQKYYHNKIKMIYIDPPYNTGKDFVYPDNYKEGLASDLDFTNQVDTEGHKVSTNSDTDGRYHSNWLNMIYPRLKLARNLLKDDGVIFMSIDDNEQDNLRKICNEIFGESNFIAQIIWQKSKKGDAKLIAKTHEYVLAYARNKEVLISKGLWRRKKLGADSVLQQYEIFRSQYKNDYPAIGKAMVAWFTSLPKDDPRKAHKHYHWSDARGLYFADNFAGPDDGRTSRPRYVILHPVTGKPCKMPSTGWRWDEARTIKALEADPPMIHFGTDETTIPCRKSYLKDIDSEPFSSVFYQDGRTGTLEVEQLIGKGVFNFPKTTGVISDLIQIATLDNNHDIILDFFCGSGTTAHAVLLLNAEDGGNRNHIQVQLPEPIDEKEIAHKLGYKKISEIAMERMRLAGEKIKKDHHSSIAFRETPLDIGFKVFKLSDSNFTKWQSASETDKDILQQHLLDIRESSNDAATEEELLTEVLLKQGISLTAKVAHEDISELSVWNIGDTTVLAYLDEHIKPNLDQLRDITRKEPAKFIILEDAFHGDDELKTNLAQICKTNKIELWTV